MSADDLLLDDTDERDRKIALLEELLQRERRRADDAEATLRDLDGLDPPDRTSWHVAAIWRGRAERDGSLRALAERVVRLAMKGKDTGAAIAAWEKELAG